MFSIGDKVRREKALDFSGCNSRPGTGSLHPVDRMRRSTPDHGWRFLGVLSGYRLLTSIIALCELYGGERSIRARRPCTTVTCTVNEVCIKMGRCELG
jgi:hypothetical protein